ncbi:MAG: formate/nitrite transporter family protein, partial [Clostridia bacterium]|nr:formate/nitrite transporter family protein [Clostridia bacterium]
AENTISTLTWSGFFINNLLPVTLGNIVGGGLFVALIYWFSYKKV